MTRKDGDKPQKRKKKGKEKRKKEEIYFYNYFTIIGLAFAFMPSCVLEACQRKGENGYFSKPSKNRHINK
jgi:hypothetical protein